MLCMDRVAIEGREIALGMTREQTMLALNVGVKVAQKPKRYTAAKLDREADLIQQLMPMYPRLTEFARKAARDCGDGCWIEILSKDIGSKSTVRVSMIGRDRANMAVYSIAFDQRGAAMRAWRSQALSDLQHDARYFVTADDTYRIAQHGTIYVIERMPQGRR
jgi:hypothetical protein